MSRRAAALFLPVALSALAGCQRYPESYPPPIQRVPEDGSALYRHVIAMNDPDATAFFIKDIGLGLEGETWRWTGPRPELRFFLKKIENPKFVMDFSIADSTFEKTGPVNVSIFVNGRLLEKIRYTKSGQHQFRKEVDPAWLKPGADTIVAAEVDPWWVSPTDGRHLGIILIQAGFVE
jgi:hypothetical protein